MVLLPASSGRSREIQSGKYERTHGSCLTLSSLQRMDAPSLQILSVFSCKSVLLVYLLLFVSTLLEAARCRFS